MARANLALNSFSLKPGRLFFLPSAAKTALNSYELMGHVEGFVMAFQPVQELEGSMRPVKVTPVCTCTPRRRHTFSRMPCRMRMPANWRERERERARESERERDSEVLGHHCT